MFFGPVHYQFISKALILIQWGLFRRAFPAVYRGAPECDVFSVGAPDTLVVRPHAGASYTIPYAGLRPWAWHFYSYTFRAHASMARAFETAAGAAVGAPASVLSDMGGFLVSFAALVPGGADVLQAARGEGGTSLADVLHRYEAPQEAPP